MSDGTTALLIIELQKLNKNIAWLRKEMQWLHNEIEQRQSVEWLYDDDK